MNKLDKITAPNARYIKLGSTGIWEKNAIDEGYLVLNYPDISHEMASRHNLEEMRQELLTKGKTPTAASDQARQIHAFYSLGAKTLWITFFAGSMWWCFAEAEVIATPRDQWDALGTRHRKVLGQWRNTSISGKPLLMAGLNGNLTKKAMYRQVICDIYPDQLDYLLRKINDEELPAVAAAQQARASIVEATVGLMKHLQANDFEILVDLVFSQSGWRRIGAVGKTQKTIDIELELPSTGERAFIQVKSHTKQWELDDYIKRFEERGDARMFYVYHSARYGIATDHPGVTLINPQRLAEMVLGAGLFDWLMQKVG